MPHLSAKEFFLFVIFNVFMTLLIILTIELLVNGDKNWICGAI
jgi:hypothetical protein